MVEVIKLTLYKKLLDRIKEKIIYDNTFSPDKVCCIVSEALLFKQDSQKPLTDLTVYNIELMCENVGFRLLTWGMLIGYEDCLKENKSK